MILIGASTPALATVLGMDGALAGIFLLAMAGETPGFMIHGMILTGDLPDLPEDGMTLTGDGTDLIMAAGALGGTDGTGITMRIMPDFITGCTTAGTTTIISTGEKAVLQTDGM